MTVGRSLSSVSGGEVTRVPRLHAGGVGDLSACVQQGGGFVPSDLSGLVLWLPGSAASKVLDGTGTLVQEWLDQSGNGNNVSAAGSARPGWNGSLVVFNGTNVMTNPTATVAPADSDMTMFVVCEALGVGAWGIIAFATGGTQLSFQCATPPNGKYILSDGVTYNVQQSAVRPTGVGLVLQWTYHNGAVPGFLMNHVVETGSNSAGAWGGAGIKLGTDNASQAWVGYVGEVITYDRILSASEIAEVNAYLFAQWGL